MNIIIKRKLDKFFAGFPVRNYDKRQILIQANNDPDGVFYLKKGQIRQYDINERGDEIVVNVFKPGAFFPMAVAINHSKNQYFYETTVPSEVIIAPQKTVVSFLHKNPDVTYDLLTRLFSGAEAIERRMAHLMGGRTRNVILHELIIECKRFGSRTGFDSYRLDIHEDELARRLGLTRETVSRELRKLKKQELINIDHKGIIIKKLGRLKEELGFEL